MQLKVKATFGEGYGGDDATFSQALAVATIWAAHNPGVKSEFFLFSHSTNSGSGRDIQSTHNGNLTYESREMLEGLRSSWDRRGQSFFIAPYYTPSTEVNADES